MSLIKICGFRRFATILFESHEKTRAFGASKLQKHEKTRAFSTILFDSHEKTRAFGASKLQKTRENAC